MDELNRNQLILLCILVSFVTSIATGILTVSLLKEPGQPISQTVNKVIERTIEKVVPGEPQEKVVTKEVPVIVTEEDLIMKAVHTASSSLVRINRKTGGKADLSLTGFMVGNDLLATIVPLSDKEDGDTVVTVAWQAETAGNTYDLSVANRVAPITIFRFGKKTAKAPSAATLVVSVISGQTAGNNATDTLSTLPLSLGTVGSIGQTVIGMGLAGLSDNTVSVGIISSLSRSSATSTPVIRTNAATLENQGGPLLNIKGEVIGISLEAGEALPAEDIKSAIDGIKK